MKLLREEPHWKDAQLILEDIIKGTIPRKVEQEYSQFLDHEISIEDLEHVFSMDPNKSPRID